MWAIRLFLNSFEHIIHLRMIKGSFNGSLSLSDIIRVKSQLLSQRLPIQLISLFSIFPTFIIFWLVYLVMASLLNFCFPHILFLRELTINTSHKNGFLIL